MIYRRSPSPEQARKDLAALRQHRKAMRALARRRKPKVLAIQDEPEPGTPPREYAEIEAAPVICGDYAEIEFINDQGERIIGVYKLFGYRRGPAEMAAEVDEAMRAAPQLVMRPSRAAEPLQ